MWCIVEQSEEGVGDILNKTYLCELCGETYTKGLPVFINLDLVPREVFSFSVSGDFTEDKLDELCLCPRHLKTFIKMGKMLNPDLFRNIRLCAEE